MLRVKTDCHSQQRSNRSLLPPCVASKVDYTAMLVILPLVLHLCITNCHVCLKLYG